MSFLIVWGIYKVQFVSLLLLYLYSFILRFDLFSDVLSSSGYTVHKVTLLDNMLMVSAEVFLTVFEVQSRTLRRVGDETDQKCDRISRVQTGTGNRQILNTKQERKPFESDVQVADSCHYINLLNPDIHYRKQLCISLCFHTPKPFHTLNRFSV